MTYPTNSVIVAIRKLSVYVFQPTHHPQFYQMHLRFTIFNLKKRHLFKIFNHFLEICSKFAGSNGTIVRMMVIWSFNFFGGCKCLFSIAYSLSINIFYVSLNGFLIHQEVVILKLSLLEARPYQSLLPVKNLLPLPIRCPRKLWRTRSDGQRKSSRMSLPHLFDPVNHELFLHPASSLPAAWLPFSSTNCIMWTLKTPL